MNRATRLCLAWLRGTLRLWRPRPFEQFHAVPGTPLRRPFLAGDPEWRDPPEHDCRRLLEQVRRAAETRETAL